MSTARAVSPPKVSPKASCLITPVPVRPVAFHTSHLVKVAPNDGVQRVNIGAAYKHWRLHRSAYQSKLTSPMRTARETPNQALTFQENLKNKLKEIGGNRDNRSPEASPKPQTQRLTYRLHNRKPLPSLVLPTSISRTDTSGPAIKETPKSAAPKTSSDLSTLTAKLRNSGSKHELTLEQRKETSEPTTDSNLPSDLSALVAKLRNASLKKTSTVETLRETPDSATKLSPQGSLIKLREKGLGTLSRLRRASEVELLPESGAIRGEELPPVETRGLIVTEVEQSQKRRGSAY